MAALNRIQPGQVLYTLTRQKMGHTTMSRLAVHEVRVVEMLPEGRGVLASWNGNTPRKFYASQVAKWRVNRPTKGE